MKLTLVTTAAAAALIAGSAGVFADDLVITGGSKSHYTSPEEKGTIACVDAFVKKIFPDSTARIRVVDQSGGTQVFDQFGGPQSMDVALTARLARSNALLARAVCTVTSTAKVTSLSTYNVDHAKMAGLTVKDIKLALVR
jgi:hypothetical protein